MKKDSVRKRNIFGGREEKKTIHVPLESETRSPESKAENSPNLDELRRQIDDVDSSIKDLLKRRLEISESIARVKQQRGLPVYDASREEAKIDRIRERASLDTGEYEVKLYEFLSSVSKDHQHRLIDGRKYGLIGHGLEHSLSPEVHRMLGTLNYDLLDAPDEGKLRDYIYDQSYSGFNITSPYKRTVIKYLDELSDDARSLGAVNAVRRDSSGRLIGYNTDVSGAVHMIRDTGVVPHKAAVMGTGGAAEAVCRALRELGAEEIIVLSRHPENCAPMPDADLITSYMDLADHRDINLIINATPVGMYPANGRTSLSESGLQPKELPNVELAADVIYNPYRTRFISIFDSSGVKTINGLPMLVWQAIGAEEIWNGPIEDSEKKRLASVIFHRILTASLNIVVVGMPGSGKSSISRRVAGQLGRDFVDTDREAEAVMDDTIQNVMKDKSRGEEYFRRAETMVLSRECKSGGKVIATGGGSVLRRVNRNCIRENGIVVYIKRPTSLLSVRNRPVSQRTGLKNLYRRRSKLYEKVADVTIVNDRQFGSRKRNGVRDTYNADIEDFASVLSEAVRRKIDEEAMKMAGREIGEEESR